MVKMVKFTFASSTTIEKFPKSDIGELITLRSCWFLYSKRRIQSIFFFFGIQITYRVEASPLRSLFLREKLELGVGGGKEEQGAI